MSAASSSKNTRKRESFRAMTCWSVFHFSDLPLSLSLPLSLYLSISLSLPLSLDCSLSPSDRHTEQTQLHCIGNSRSGPLSSPSAVTLASNNYQIEFQLQGEYFGTCVCVWLGGVEGEGWGEYLLDFLSVCLSSPPSCSQCV